MGIFADDFANGHLPAKALSPAWLASEFVSQ
jgi:hypothetical protein